MTEATDPDTYTHGHHDSVLRSHRWRTAENSAAYLLPHLQPGMTLLDVGCGPGTLTCDLADRVAPGQVLAVDLSAEVVDEAGSTAAERGTTNVTFQIADFRELDGTFDVVHAHQVLQHVGDPVGALRRMAELARPGGGLVAARDGDYPAMFWHPASAALDRWREVYLGVTRHNDAEAAAARHLPTWARAAGLTDVAYTTSTWTYVGDDIRWWADSWAERTVGSSFARQAVEYGIATDGDLAGIAAGWRDWGTHADAVFVVVNGELLARV
jgi:2-polyprenyl-3-methyl-5-hydroxy-6-metoxy-1,4-benzoquinol methylase